MRTNWADSQDLALLRESKGISLETIAETTHIGIRYLAAIEKGQFAKLPGGVYNLSYIRQYAGALGCDASMILERYHNAAEDAPQPPADTPSANSARSLIDWLIPRALLNVSMRRLRKI